MSTQQSGGSVRLVDLAQGQLEELVIPEGTIATFDLSSEELAFSGTIRNLGTLRFLGTTNLDSHTVLLAEEVINDGLIESHDGLLCLGAGRLKNEGHMIAGSIFLSGGPDGDIVIEGNAGNISADGELLLKATGNILVKGGTFSASKIGFESVEKDVIIEARRLDGPVHIKGFNVKCGTREGDLDLREQCVIGDPIYYCTTGSITINDPVSAAEDIVVLAKGTVTVEENLTTTSPGRNIVIRAGVTFDPPMGGEDCAQDPNDPAPCPGGTCEIPETSPGQPGDIMVMGSLTSQGLVELKAENGTITVNGMVTASGKIEVLADGDITFEADVTAMGDTDSFVSIKSTGSDGNIKAKMIKAPGNIVLSAKKNIEATTIDATGPSNSFKAAIDINANMAAGSSQPFIVGQDTGGNGVEQFIAQGRRKSDTEFEGGVRVSNKGNGGILVKDSITIQQTNGENGLIILDADEGNLVLPGGTLSVDGDSKAGELILLADKIFANGPSLGDGKTILSANQGGEGTAQHFINLAATEIQCGLSGVDIMANGNGTAQITSFIALQTKGALKVESNQDAEMLSYTLTRPDGASGTDSPLTISGSGPFNVNCDGKNTQLFITGKPVTIDLPVGALSQFTTKGENGFVRLEYTGSASSGDEGLKFMNGNVEFLADGMDDKDGGFVIFFFPKVEINAGSIVARASGDGSGNGGNVEINASNGNISKDQNAGNLELIANGGSDNAEGGFIRILSDNGNQDLFNVVARANGQGSGKGGMITQRGKALSLDQVTYAANGGDDGDGGIIDVSATMNLNINNASGMSGPSLFRAAAGLSSGNGQRITIGAQGDLLVGPNVTFNSSADGDGYAGDIGLSAQGSTLSLPNASTLLRAISTTNANENKPDISLFAPNGTITNNATINAPCNGAGNGGIVFISGSTVVLKMEAVINVDGGLFEGNAGTIRVIADNYTNEGVTLRANARAIGIGGNIFLTSNSGPLMITPNTSIVANAIADNGQGGNIEINSPADITISEGSFINANGKNDKGGRIQIGTQQTLSIDKAQINANGTENSFGGEVNLAGNAITLTDAFVRANGDRDDVNPIGVFIFGTGTGDITITQTNPSAGGILANGATTNSFAAGEVRVNNENGNIIIGQDTRLTANGIQGNAVGGVISIFTTKNLSVMGTISTAGFEAGSGGAITLDCDQLTASAAILRALSGNNGAVESKGGDITITAKTFVQPTVNNLLNARGMGSANGGSITFNSSGTSGLFLGNTTRSYRPLAEGGATQGDGGSIVVNAPLTDVTFDQGTLDVSAKNDGAGGLVTIQAKEIKSGVAGGTSISANGFGSKPGGSITFQSQEGVSIGTSPNNFKLFAQSFGSGNGGTIFIRSLSIDGKITVNGAQLLVNPQGTGNGGNITLIGGPTSLGSPTLEVSGELNCSAANGTAGQLILSGHGPQFTGGPIRLLADGLNGEITIVNTGGDDSLNFAADSLVSAKGGSGSITIDSSSNALGGGSTILLQANARIETSLPGQSGGGIITFLSGSQQGDITVQNNGGRISADGGLIIFNLGSTTKKATLNGSAPIGRIEVNADALSMNLSGDNTDVLRLGNLTCNNQIDIDLTGGRPISQDSGSISGSSVTLNAEGDITVRDISGTTDISIKATMLGNIIYASGVLQAPMLTIETENGSIGSASAALATEVQTLNAKTGVSGGDVYINNSGSPLTLEDLARSGGDFSLTNDDDLTVASITSGGSLFLQGVGHNLLVEQAADIEAQGSIALEGGTNLTLSANTRVAATGNISLSNGPVSSPTCEQTTNTEPSCAPANVNGTVSNGGSIFWGSDLDSQATLLVDAIGRTVLFDGNGSPIITQSGVVVFAS